MQSGRWLPRLFALLAGAALAGSVVFWVLRLSTPREPVVPPAAGEAATQAVPADAARLAALLGGGSGGGTGGGTGAAAAADEPAAAALAGRFVITGVVAGPPAQGVALIAVDGKPARPYLEGAEIEAGVVLQSVAPRKAVLAASHQGPPLLTLELPAPAAAAGAP